MNLLRITCLLCVFASMIGFETFAQESPVFVNYDNERYILHEIDGVQYLGCQTSEYSGINYSGNSSGYVYKVKTSESSISIPSSITIPYWQVEYYPILDELSHETGESSSEWAQFGETTINVVGICSGAFDNMENLINVTLPASLKSIHGNAFNNCGLMSLNIPDGVTSICETPSNVCESSICYGCKNLKSLYIPKSLTGIYYVHPISLSDNLETIVVDNENPTYDSRNNCNAIINTITNTLEFGCNSTIIPEDVSTIGSGAFADCKAMTTIVIPSSVTTIYDNSFMGCSNLTTVILKSSTPPTIYPLSYTNPFSNAAQATLYVPAGSKEAYQSTAYWQEFKEIIEMSASSSVINFADANVKSLCIAKWDTDGDGELSEAEAASVTSLGSTFKENQNITSFDELKYFTGLSAIGVDAFLYSRSLESIMIPQSVKNINDRAFMGCEKLKELVIPASVATIGSGAFLDCGIGLTSIRVESGNANYDSRDGCNAIIETATNTLLWGCDNTIIPNTVASIGNSAFSHCLKVSSLQLPEDLTSIGDYAFYNCKDLAGITIPDKVEAIGNDAFWHCDNLSSVIIGSGVSRIGETAFQSCNKLTSVTVMNRTPIVITSEVFSNRANATLYVPAGSKAAYEAADYWKEFKEIVELGGEQETTDISTLDNTVYIENVEANVGGQLTLSVKMKNDVQAEGFGFDLYLPDGVTVATDGDGFPMVELSTERTTAKKTNSFDAAFQTDGCLRVLAASTNGSAISGNDGEVCLITVNIADDMEEGDYPIVLKNIAISDVDAVSHRTEMVKSTLTVSAYTPADANNDGVIDVSDFTATAHYLLGNTPAGFNEKAADANNDGVVDVADLTATAHIILYGSITKPAQSHANIVLDPQ